MHTRIVQRKTNWALEISDWFARDVTAAMFGGLEQKNLSPLESMCGKAWSLGHYPRNTVVEIDLAVPFFPAYSFISICGIIMASLVVSRGIL